MIRNLGLALFWTSIGFLFLNGNPQGSTSKDEEMTENNTARKNAKNPLKHAIVWHWDDDFNSEEKQKIKNWLEATTIAVQGTLGVYPFEIHLHLHSRRDSNEPVPWANTRRFPGQSVYFYLNPEYSYDSFME